MLNDLQAWFFWDPTTVSSLVFGVVGLAALVVFYALLRKKDPAPQEDAYEDFLAEEFKVTLSTKQPEVLQLPPEPKIVVFDEPVAKKPAAKKAAKKKAAKKKAAKKKTTKPKEASAK